MKRLTKEEAKAVVEQWKRAGPRLERFRRDAPTKEFISAFSRLMVFIRGKSATGIIGVGPLDYQDSCADISAAALVIAGRSTSV